MQAASLNEEPHGAPYLRFLCTLRGLPFGYLYDTSCIATAERLAFGSREPRGHHRLIVINECCIARRKAHPVLGSSSGSENEQQETQP